MASTPYARGREFEYRVRDSQPLASARLVIRAAGSKGPVDLVAIWDGGNTWLVQVKKDGVMSPAQRKALRELAGHVGAEPILARAGKANRGVEIVNLNLAVKQGAAA